MTTQARNSKASSESGFSLIELLIAVTIVGILTALTIPAYGRYVLRSKLPEAFAMLGDYRLRMEQYNQDNRTYANPGLNSCAVAPPLTGKYFDIQCTITAVGARFTYTATANSKAGQNLGNAGDYSYSIDQDGIRNTVRFAGATGPAGSWQDK